MVKELGGKPAKPSNNMVRQTLLLQILVLTMVAHYLWSARYNNVNINIQKTNMDISLQSESDEMLEALKTQHKEETEALQKQVAELKERLEEATQKTAAAPEENDEAESTEFTQTANAPLAEKALGKPIIVLGMPKSGTTSVYSYFNCSGVRTQHYCSQGDLNDHPPCAHGTMANCMLKNLEKRHKGETIGMMEGCGEYDVYAQIDAERPTKKVMNPDGKRVSGSVNDDGTADYRHMMRMFLPQHFLLEELHQEHPEATYILPLRTPQAWASSVDRWFMLKQFFFQEYHYQSNETMEMPPRNQQIRLAWLEKVYEAHTEHVRKFIQEHPSHRLVEVNISDTNAGNLMEDVFGYDKKCWGHANKNGKKQARQ